MRRHEADRTGLYAGLTVDAPLKEYVDSVLSPAWAGAEHPDPRDSQVHRRVGAVTHGHAAVSGAFRRMHACARERHSLVCLVARLSLLAAGGTAECMRRTGVCYALLHAEHQAPARWDHAATATGCAGGRSTGAPGLPPPGWQHVFERYARHACKFGWAAWLTYIRNLLVWNVSTELIALSIAVSLINACRGHAAGPRRVASPLSACIKRRRRSGWIGRSWCRHSRASAGRCVCNHVDAEAQCMCVDAPCEASMLCPNGLLILRLCLQEPARCRQRLLAPPPPREPPCSLLRRWSLERITPISLARQGWGSRSGSGSGRGQRQRQGGQRQGAAAGRTLHGTFRNSSFLRSMAAVPRWAIVLCVHWLFTGRSCNGCCTVLACAGRRCMQGCSAVRA